MSPPNPPTRSESPPCCSSLNHGVYLYSVTSASLDAAHPNDSQQLEELDTMALSKDDPQRSITPPGSFLACGSLAEQEEGDARTPNEQSPRSASQILEQDTLALSIDRPIKQESPPRCSSLAQENVGSREETDSFELSSEYANDEGAIFLCAAEYAQQKAQVDELVSKVLTAEKRLSQVTDPEEKNSISERLNTLNKRLETICEFMDTLRVKEEPVEAETPRWANLFSGLNRHRKKSKLSLAAFFQNKTNIINSLKALYEPSEPKPTSEDVAEQPSLLLVTLLKHQKSGLRWMQFRERQKICGGILADDMGLGKTLSMIALVLSSLEAKKKERADKQQALRSKWTQQLCLKATKKFNLFDDEENDKEDEKYEPPTKRQLLASPDDLFDSDDDDCVENEPYPKAGTLVVCPMSVMCQWAQEVATKVAANALTVLTFHGPNRHDQQLRRFRSYDLVITSYSTVVSEYRKYGSRSLLFTVNWHRVILDEAHIIRNTKTIGCFAICQLRAIHHWALTGTPIQNRAIDVFALMQFLNVPNFQDLQQWKKYLNEGMAGHRRLGFIIKPLMLRRTKQQLQATGGMPALPPLTIQLIAVQLSEEEMAVYQVLSAISQRIFAQYLTQRDKGNSDLNYYSLENTPHFMGENFEDKYMEIYHRFLRSLGYDPRAKIQGIVILVLLLRLRQFCCHPGMMIGMLCGPMSDDEVNNLREDAEDVEGPLKSDVLSELKKYHVPGDKENYFEDENISSSNPKIKIENSDDKSSVRDEKVTILESFIKQEPSCSSSATQPDPFSGIKALQLMSPQNPIFDFSRSSAKLKLVIEKLEELLNGTGDKIIVVSQWITFIGVIRQRLNDLCWSTLDFTGQLSAKERELVLRDFNNPNNDKRVLLLSLSAGGVGLNLNVANHMLLVDLHWNPQLQKQAQDRIYRYGQKKPTFIYRFMCQETVEQRIKALQDYKLEIAKVVLPEEEGGVSTRQGGGLNLQEIKKLFSM
ncbi:transcription termination factor 2 isoform X2 [Drosophila ananassae]|uniref:transcription termination factor 2 isoform X2 n=1 Tax=Drosophila ananassae TaxID=7217 RepID=UPI0013A5C07B|nr:transcription termination factor 2 isoform X2 [Drosophila ananassae]